MNQLLLYTSFFLTIFCIQSQAIGQDNYPDSLNYSINTSLSGTRIAGIFSRTSVVVGTNLVLKQNRWEFHEDFSYRFNNTNGFKFEDNISNVAFLNYHLGGSWNWFPILFHQYEDNIIYRVDRRNRLGVGIGAHPLSKNGNSFRVTTGYYYENETYNNTNPTGGDPFGFENSELLGAQRKNNNVWIHTTNKLPLSKQINFQLDLWFFQSFKESSDYSFSVFPKLNAKINKHFSFFIRYDYRFENVYLEPLVNANELLIFGVNANFAN